MRRRLQITPLANDFLRAAHELGIPYTDDLQGKLPFDDNRFLLTITRRLRICRWRRDVRPSSAPPRPLADRVPFAAGPSTSAAKLAVAPTLLTVQYLSPSHASLLISLGSLHPPRSQAADKPSSQLQCQGTLSRSGLFASASRADCDAGLTRRFRRHQGHRRRVCQPSRPRARSSLRDHRLRVCFLSSPSPPLSEP